MLRFVLFILFICRLDFVTLHSSDLCLCFSSSQHINSLFEVISYKISSVIVPHIVQIRKWLIQSPDLLFCSAVNELEHDIFPDLSRVRSCWLVLLEVKLQPLEWEIGFKSQPAGAAEISVQETRPKIGPLKHYYQD